MCVLYNIASSFHCHTCWLEFKMLLPPVTKQKTPAYIREIQVYKCWTKVYSRKGLTAMVFCTVGVMSYSLHFLRGDQLV